MLLNFFIYKLFRKKDVKVNKKPKNIDYITQVDDVITIYITKEQEESFIEKKEIEENILTLSKKIKQSWLTLASSEDEIEEERSGCQQSGDNERRTAHQVEW